MLKALAKTLYLGALRRYAFVRLRTVKQRAHGLPFPLVVSLTSYSKRFDTLAPTLATLLSQEVKADATVLWIAPADIDALPADVRALEAHGLTIRTTPDLRSYKKIIPALEAYPDAAIVTADDDVYYPADWLGYLADDWRADRREILCTRAHRMQRKGDGLAPYVEWDHHVSDLGDSPNLFGTGIGGILYPPGIFHPDVTRVDRLLELCPTTDDVWLNWMARLSGATVRRVGPRRRFREWPGSQEVALMNVNFVNDSNNDRQIAQIVAAYGIPENVR